GGRHPLPLAGAPVGTARSRRRGGPGGGGSAPGAPVPLPAGAMELRGAGAPCRAGPAGEVSRARAGPGRAGGGLRCLPAAARRRRLDGTARPFPPGRRPGLCPRHLQGRGTVAGTHGGPVAVQGFTRAVSQAWEARLQAWGVDAAYWTRYFDLSRSLTVAA